MRDPDGRVGGLKEKENIERAILIEGTIMGLGRNSYEYTSISPAGTPSNSGEGA